MSSDPIRDPHDPAGDPSTPTEAAPTEATRAEAAPVRVPAPAPRAGLPSRTTPPPAIDKAPLDLARRIVELAEDRKAADIILLEIAPLTTVADYLVLCSGGSERQLGAIADGITEGLKAEGIRILSREGAPDSHWVLLDAGAVVVHVFAPPEREFYALERLWAQARTVLRVQ
ncbi:MAG: ribosome silencing factor [Chloroflexota bacterium]